MNTHPEAPKPPCTLYAMALPGLRAGTLSLLERQALRRHLRDCPTCRAQAEAASAQVIEDAVRRHYGVPNTATATPFLTLDDIRRRMASPEPNQQHELDEIHGTPELSERDEIEVNDTLLHLFDRGAIMQTEQQEQRPPRTLKPLNRWRASVAVAAVIALIAVFALVMHSFAGPGRGTHSIPATHITHPGKWAKLFTLGTKDVITVAPNNPNVIYRVLTSGLEFQRSDDGDKTWKTFTAPSQKIVNDPSPRLSLQVSPLNPQVVLATIQSNASNPNCPPAGPTGEVSHSTTNQMAELATMRAFSGPAICSFQYVSTDGGATWTTPDVPIESNIVELSFDINGNFVTQGNRFYGTLAPDIHASESDGFRLVSSTDGVHWSAADAQLVARNLTIMQCVATTSGSTLFATTIPWGQTSDNRELWRSDDGGANWTDLGAFPEEQPKSDTFTYLMGAANVGGETIVYYATVTASWPNPYNNTNNANSLLPGVAPDNVFASEDNGKTWQAAPMANIPHGLQAASVYTFLLDDGSLILDFDSRFGNSKAGSLTFYSWKPGDTAWKQLSQPLAAEPMPQELLQSSPVFAGGAYSYGFELWLTPAHNDSPATIWALATSQDGIYMLWSCALS